MDAVISGRAGKALLLDGDSLKSFDVDDPSKLVPRRQSDLPYLFGETQDLRVIEDTDIESVQQELKHDCHCNWALDLALISLDAELPDEIRQEALEGLDELLADSRVVERLENILYARPLPEDADLAGALNLCGETRFSNAHALMQRFQERQVLISEVSNAWETIPTKIFGSYDQQAEFQHVAVREGLFRTLVITLENQDKASSPNKASIHLASAKPTETISMFLLNTGLNNSIKKLRSSWQVLQAWTSPFRQPSDAPKIKPEGKEEDESETSTRRRHGRRIGIDRPAVLREVNRKKAIIMATMKGRDIERARELVDDLVRYHLSNSESKHTAKSLCDLAMEAKTLGMYPLQLELTERSINIAPDDAWSWAQHGDALLNMQRLNDALKAYQQSEAFGGRLLGSTGKAGVLKAMGRLGEALAAFDDAILKHSEDVVAKSGRADVLKAMGRFDEALAAFDALIVEYSGNVIAKTGRAEVLKAMGRLDEALAAYNEVILDHPNNGITIRGRSCVLAALGRYDEALVYLPDKNPRTLNDWIGYHIRGMILLRTGKVGEAIRIFNEDVQNDPLPSSRAYSRTALAVASLRGGEFKKASQILEEVTSPLMQPLANVFRLHAFGAQGERQRAIAAYDSLATSPNLRSNELTQELHRQFILGEEAHHDEDWFLDREVKIILLAA
jgi:tetratricopeptide (TPR) repeat protein